MDVVVKVFDDYSCYDIPEDAAGFMAFFAEKLETIPDEYRHSAKIEVRAETCYDSAILAVEIYYYRPETEQEVSDRLAKQAAKEAQNQARKLAEFQRLRDELGL